VAVAVTDRAAREAVLGRIRAALADVPADEPPAYAVSTAAPDRPRPTGADLIDQLAERIADYRATVTRVGERDAVADALAAILARHDARRIAVPADLPSHLRPAGRDVELVADDPPLAPDALGALDGVLTGCALAIAETGTIVLDTGAAQGRRALTLLPDLHVCVVAVDQVVATVPEAIARLAGITRPILLISGPSATSDIELDRVEGVHGPRRLEVVIVG
jgi:L-lactate dehydrogenase complex protein LldG